MKTKTILSAAICILLLAAAGFLWKASAQYPAETVVRSGDYRIVVKLIPLQAKVLKPTALQVSVFDANEQPVDSANVSISLFMARMFCGTVSVETASKGQGVFGGEAIALMPGSWTAEANVTIDGQTVVARHVFEAVR
ncbi:hypothetical protein [Paenibacillus sp. MBLB4367]|uniref:hypothetical protein n=1 Tax=Paenibacillus sp. MBLB4367 TaxID=3384767 RepID=UPI003908332F